MAKRGLRLDRVRIHWEPDPTSTLPDAERCEAIAVVSYLIGPEGDRRTERLVSGGLNGIDGAVGAYRKEVEREQLRDLRDHLEVFKVDVLGYDWKQHA